MCQACDFDKELQPILSLDSHPLVHNLMESQAAAVLAQRYPLDLVRCPACELVQLKYVPSEENVFPRSYPYRSGVTGELVVSLRDLVKDVRSVVQPGVAVDIGANDGTLLDAFKDSYNGSQWRTIAIEPSDAIEDCALGHERIQGYFSEKMAREVFHKESVDVVTATNVFAHTPNPRDFLKAIKYMLKPNGVFASESHYLVDLIGSLQYDTIYHEHRRYYHLGSLLSLFHSEGFSVFQVKRTCTHGGSLRVLAYPTSCRIRGQSGVLSTLAGERDVSYATTLIAFAKEVERQRNRLIEIINQAKTRGRRVVGVGAPARCSTVLNYADLTHKNVEYIAEQSNSPKIGLFLPGSGIPVVDEKILLEEPENTVILNFAWHLRGLPSRLQERGVKGKIVPVIR